MDAVGGLGYFREAGGTADQEQIKLMMQALLADRFGLKFHRETKDQPVYALVVDKGGAKLKESTGSGDLLGNAPPKQEGGRGPGGRQGIRISRGQIAGQGMTMASLSSQLSNILGRQVLDKTSLAGSYDITLNWTPEENQGMRIPGDNRESAPPSASDAGPNIFNAVREQLGLKLEAQRGPVEIFAIDHVERASEN